MSMRQPPVFSQYFIVEQFEHAAKVRESHCESLYPYYLDPTTHILFLFKSLVYILIKKIL